MRLPAGSAPVFVVGSPRSGTSVVAWALAEHPCFATGPESDFLYYLAKLPDLERAYDVSIARADGWLALHSVGKEEYLAALGIGLDLLFQSRSDGKRWVDSTPACVLVCARLAALFPGARFVHMLRDGRAAVSSMLASGFDARLAREFDFACRTWADYARAGWIFAHERSDVCLQVRQEELATQPEAVLTDLQRFLGVEPDARVHEFARQGRLNSSWGNLSSEDVRRMKPADSMPKAPWKEWSAEKRQAFEDIAGETMRLVGYDAASD